MKVINKCTEYQVGDLVIREERDKTTDIVVFDTKNNILCSFTNWSDARNVADAIREVYNSIFIDTCTEYGDIRKEEK